MTFEDYVEQYKKTGRLPATLPGRKRPYSELELRKKYEKYARSFEKKSSYLRGRPAGRTAKVDPLWEKTKVESRQEYGTVCLLLYKSPPWVRDEIEERSGGISNIVDPAHVFPKGAYPHMKYVAENVVPLNRYSHSMLDQQCDPITGKQVPKEEIAKWWEYIVGKERYKSLEILAEKR